MSTTATIERLDIVDISISIEILDGKYKWTYKSAHSDFDPDTGNVTVHGNRPLLIMYRLDQASSQTYNLIYANMATMNCASHEIRQVVYTGDCIIIHAANTTPPGPLPVPPTDNPKPFTEFKLHLVARIANDMNAPIISSDPEVLNDPLPN